MTRAGLWAAGCSTLHCLLMKNLACDAAFGQNSLTTCYYYSISFQCGRPGLTLEVSY